MEQLKKAIEFTEKIKNIKGILMVALFGSVARGEATKNSDIDIAVIYDGSDRSELFNKVNKFKDEQIQLTFLDIKDIYKETELVGAISGEGLLLFGNPIILQEKRLKLAPKILFTYNLNRLSQTEKVKFNRAIYGSTSKSVKNNRVYTTETKGIVAEPGIENISRGVFLVDRKKANKLKSIFKVFNIEYREIPFWTYAL